MTLMNSFSSLWQDGPDVMIRVHVHAGAKRDAILSEHDHALRIDIKAAPERGAANNALVRFFAQLFGKAVADIEVRHGHVCRNKLLVIRNCLCADLAPIVIHNLRSSSR